MADADSTPGKSPAFQFYPKDFLTDEHVKLMSLAERGAYITLICQCWTEGSLPSDPVRLSRLCGVPQSAFKKLWPALEPCFRPAGRRGSDRLIHPRLEKEREKQAEYRGERSAAGKRGAEKRWHRHSTANGSAIKEPMAKHSSSSAICDLRSADSSQESTASTTDVQRVIERHEELHRQYRGVGYIGNAQKDYQAACELVAAFPDPALQDAILVYGLNDTDPWMDKGSRTLARIKSQASKYAELLKAKRLA